MALSRLSGRLSRIRELKQNAQFPPSKQGLAVSSQELPGWKETKPYLFERTTTVVVDGYRNSFSSHLPLLFPRERDSLKSLASSPGFAGNLVFFDLETTGLSHGAGTVAFMAGIARFTEESPGSHPILRIQQILLADYPGESAFLSRFIELVGDNPVFVSFNGKCFDSQILFTRFMMNGMRPSFLIDPALHLDLLFPSRRLWKKLLGSCRLSVIETEILGVTRIDDLGGSEAPDAWFDYVRNGIPGRLLAIGEHNLTDCESLSRLLFALDHAIDTGTGRAALIRALDLRAQKDYQGVVRLLEPLAREGDPLALRILAIDAEHRIRNLDLALEFAALLGDENRTLRIRKKIGNFQK